MKTLLNTFFLLLLTTQLGFCQEIPVVRSVAKAYSSKTRCKNGKPGMLYWQNTGCYDIRINFIPATRLLNGSLSINYSNNSPDTLKTLVFKLYPNIYKDNSTRNMPVASGDLTKGVQIMSLSVDGREVDSTQRIIRGTNMNLKQVQVLPGQKVHVSINYQYTLNKGSFIRTGQIDTGAFFIAYFFPRIAVYDDVDGWNEHPYDGKEEFYNDYDNFHVEISVPGNFQVWATGELKNTNEVYASKFVKRITEAAQNDSVTNVITKQDLKTGKITTNPLGNTWKFDAEHVTDFAFAISKHYVWKAASVLVDSVTKRRTRVDAVFNADHEVFNPVVGYAGKTVSLISHYFPKVPFPYSHETIFEGLDAMEYPMMVNILPVQDHNQFIELMAHEVFHTLFPFYVGTNETKYSFMDEGWATMTEFLFSPLIDNTVSLKYDISDVNNAAGLEEDVPIMTPTPQLYGKARYADKDLKPALGLLYLKEMIGEQLFLKALRYYIDNWQGKHPTPYDFFNSMNTSTNINLNWLWKNWFFEKNIPDLAISKVTHHQLAYKIIVSSPGTLFVPIHLKIIYTDGSTVTLTKDISCWNKGNKTVCIVVKAKKQISHLLLGDSFDVDIHPENNSKDLMIYHN